MQDESIIALYWQRDETAIRKTEQKYGRYLNRIAYNILADREDSEESVNDTYWRAWESIPPHRPGVLATYLGKITRQLSIDIFRKKHREKRKSSEYALSLEELGDCVDGGEGPQEQAELRLLADALSRFLRTLPPGTRTAFIARYYYLDPIKEIAACRGMSESKLKSLLYRTRQQLRAYLQKEGFTL